MPRALLDYVPTSARIRPGREDTGQDHARRQSWGNCATHYYLFWQILICLLATNLAAVREILCVSQRRLYHKVSHLP